MGAIIRIIFAAIRAALRGGARVAPRVASFGRIAFRGLIGNRPLQQLTHTEVRNAFQQVGLREAHNGHFIKRLIERGGNYGIRNLNDFARQFNNATARAGKYPGTIELVLPGGRAAIVTNQSGHLITLTPL